MITKNNDSNNSNSHLSCSEANPSAQPVCITVTMVIRLQPLQRCLDKTNTSTAPLSLFCRRSFFYEGTPGLFEFIGVRSLAGGSPKRGPRRTSGAHQPEPRRSTLLCVVNNQGGMRTSIQMAPASIYVLDSRNGEFLAVPQLFRSMPKPIAA